MSRNTFFRHTETKEQGYSYILISSQITSPDFPTNGIENPFHSERTCNFAILSQLWRFASRRPSCFKAWPVGQKLVVSGGVVGVVVEEEVRRVVDRFVFLETRQQLFSPRNVLLFHSS